MKKSLKKVVAVILILCVGFLGYKAYENVFLKDKKPSNSPETTGTSEKNVIEWLFMSYANEDIDTYCETQPQQVKDAMENEDFKKYVKALVKRGSNFYGAGVEIELKEGKSEITKQRISDITDEVNMVYSDLFDEFDMDYENISIDEGYELVVDIKSEDGKNDRIGIKVLTLKTSDGEWIVWHNKFMEIAGLVCEYDYYDYERDYDLD